jgi:hypothetical protein
MYQKTYTVYWATLFALKQEVLGRTNRLLPFDITRTA